MSDDLTVRFEYKCRRCGEINRPAGCEAKYAQSVLAEIKTDTRVTCVHVCKDGGYGLSDLLGCTPPIEPIKLNERAEQTKQGGA